MRGRREQSVTKHPLREEYTSFLYNNIRLCGNPRGVYFFMANLKKSNGILTAQGDFSTRQKAQAIIVFMFIFNRKRSRRIGEVFFLLCVVVVLPEVMLRCECGMSHRKFCKNFNLTDEKFVVW